MVKLLFTLTALVFAFTLSSNASPIDSVLEPRGGTEIGNGRRPPSKLAPNLLVARDDLHTLAERGGTEVGNGKKPPSKPGSNLKAREKIAERGVEAGNAGGGKPRVKTASIVQRNIEKRAGPSGQLLQPAGGSFIYTEVSWPGSGE